MGGGGKSKRPKVQQIEMPSAPAPAPPPEETAMAPVVQDEMTSRTKNRDSKKRGTSALRIELVGGGGLGTSVGAASGLNLPRSG